MPYTGTNTIAGIRGEKGKDFGNAQVLNNQDFVPLVSESLLERVSMAGINTKSGQFFLNKLFAPYGGIVVEGFYDGITVLLALFFGKEFGSFPVANSAENYIHFFQLDDNLSTRKQHVTDALSPSGNIVRRGTFAVDRNGTIHEFISTFVKTFNFTVKSGEIRFSFNLIPSMFRNKETVNTDLSSLDLSDGSRMLFKDLKVYYYPLFRFTVTSSDSFNLFEDGATSAVTVTPTTGEYSPQELAIEIQKKLNSASTQGYKYFVYWYPNLKKFRIFCTGKFDVNGAGILRKMGFWYKTTYSVVRQKFSDVKAITDGFKSFTTSDELKIIELELNSERIVRQRSGKGEFNVFEPLTLGKPTGTLSIITRPDFDLNNNVGDPFALKLVFTGKTYSSGGQEQFIIYFPYCTLSVFQNSGSGPQQVKNRLSFNVGDPVYFDFVNFSNSKYLMRNVSVPGNPLALAVHDKHLIFATDESGTYNIRKLNIDGSTEVLFSVSGKPYSLISFQGDVFVGGTGIVYKWDGSSVTSNPVSSGPVSGFEIYGEKLAVCTSQSNAVWVYEGTSWTQIRSGSGTTQAGIGLKSYNGKLYFLFREDSAVKIEAWDGSSWSLVGSFSTATNYGIIEVVQGKLFVTIYDATATVEYFDGNPSSIWYSLSQTVPKRFSTVYKNGLIFITGGVSTSDSKLYFYDFEAQQDVLIGNINSQLEVGSKLVTFNNILYFISTSGYLSYLDVNGKMQVLLSNTYNENPLL